MITIEQITAIQDDLRELKKDIVKLNKLKDKNSADMPYKKLQKLLSDISYQNYYIDKKIYSTHCEIIEAGLAGYFNDDYYKTVEYNPSQLYNKIEFTREKPIKK
ncbi:MAG: hypothetical protein Unbinned6284contig1004_41 [Prokaryotic dsDNA virus sp.]|nr:MAG: hypothetical protein Unbinned6284contig1004_41 [Prokaryotic dsDNA virus sp.]|tara:strand:- start:5581 stop:5892 length:312 start_codon:yes stop_codon:yes gene_type:complete